MKNNLLTNRKIRK